MIEDGVVLIIASGSMNSSRNLLNPGGITLWCVNFIKVTRFLTGGLSTLYRSDICVNLQVISSRMNSHSLKGD